MRHCLEIYLWSSGTLLMPWGLFDETVAKETKAKLKRSDTFRNTLGGDLDADTKNMRWRKSMGEKLEYSASNLRKNLDHCLIASRYDFGLVVLAVQHCLFSKSSEDCWCIY